MKTAPLVDLPSFHLRRSAPRPLCLQIAAQLGDAISCGRLPVGTRLPSTRSLAAALGVSRNTAATAYDELLAGGFIAGRVGDGSYVVRGIRCVRFSDVDGNPLLLRAVSI